MNDTEALRPINPPQPVLAPKQPGAGYSGIDYGADDCVARSPARNSGKYTSKTGAGEGNLAEAVRKVDECTVKQRGS